MTDSSLTLTVPEAAASTDIIQFKLVLGSHTEKVKKKKGKEVLYISTYTVDIYMYI